MVRFDESMFWDLKSAIIKIDLYYVKIKCGYVKFLNICKRLDVEERIKKDGYFYHQIFKVNGWLIPRDIFYEAFLKFQDIQQYQFTAWNKQNDFLKMLELLHIVFESNRKAHNQQSHHRSVHFFNKKQKLLEKAVKFARDFTQVPFFHFGMKYDMEKTRYIIVLMFQIENTQVSFHTEDFEDLPEFPFEWDKIEHKTFPFSYNKVKQLVKESKIQFSFTNENEIPLCTKEGLELYLTTKTNRTPIHIEKPKIEPVIKPTRNRIKESKKEGNLKTLDHF